MSTATTTEARFKARLVNGTACVEDTATGKLAGFTDNFAAVQAAELLERGHAKVNTFLWRDDMPARRGAL
jgi:hypothetical protein